MERHQKPGFFGEAGLRSLIAVKNAPFHTAIACRQKTLERL
jgi:hypothetical protein